MRMLIAVFAAGLLSSCGEGQAGEAPNSAPTRIFLSVSAISERAPVDSVVGTLTVSDPDPGDTHTFQLLDNNDKFAIVDDELRTAGELDFETRAAYDLGIRATDSGGLTRDEVISVNLTDELEVSNNDDDGAGSLRELLTTAPAGSTVFVEPEVQGTILLTSGPITIDSTVSLVGPGQSALSISGGDAQNILSIGAPGDLTLSGVTLTSSMGSAISNAGSLTLTDATIRDSTVSGFGRGACLSSFGTLSVARVTFTGCSAFNAGAVDVAAQATFESATFTANSTTGNSGAAMIVDGAADVTITNCTFSGNFVTDADRVGGAIGVSADGPSSGRLVLRHNSFVDNTATGDGGAIYIDADATVDIEGNLFAGNTAVNGRDIFADPLATLTSLGFNLLEDGDSSGLTNGVNDDIVGQIAMVGPLADNGGPTETHALSPGSPAIDAIPPESCSVTTDQREMTRPRGSGCDIGSLEQ